METAESHQKLAEAAIGRLTEHTRGLDAVVRSLQTLKRAANARTTLWTLGCGAIAVTCALLVAWWFLPKPAEIAALRAERDELASNIALLDRYGARADLRRCGAGRVCVRVDLKAPRYGDRSDYLVIWGY